jgi:hypothetical protein
VRRVKILDRFQFQPGRVDLVFYRSNFRVSPGLVSVAGQAPTGVISNGLIARAVAVRRTKIIHQVNDQVRAPALPGEAKMFFVQLVPVEPQPKFHECKMRTYVNAAIS